MAILRVLHLVGSATSEFYADLSRLYAEDCWVATADANSFVFYIAYVTPDRQWRFPSSLHPEAIALAPPMALSEALPLLTALNLDLMLPQMFCLAGMTEYRALFDLLRIPYIGNPADLMALAAHKSKTKAIVAAAGVRVPRSELLHPGDVPTLATPAVIKPVDTDNSLGLALVRDAAEYDAALSTAFTYGTDVLVETFIELGREVRCGIIVQNGELICLPLEEYQMDPVDRPIRSYQDKLNRDDQGQLGMVAKGNEKSWIVDLHDPITAPVWAMARQCHMALGCRHYSLFDFRIDPIGQPWFLEAGLYCSFAETSVISAMAKAAGIPLNRLFQSMVGNALNQS
jgi:D-alanine-D-alanine ligase